MGSRGLNYYPHHIGDYDKDTKHLTMLEDSAYRRMLDIYYGTERPLPRDQQAIYRLVRARSHAEKLAVDVVIGEFFTEGDDGWHNARADAEIAKAVCKSDKARASAGRRWHSDGNANAMRTHSDGNAPNNQQPRTNNQKVKSIVGLRPDALQVLNFLNEKTGRSYEPVPANVEMIVARMKEGASVEDCKAVVAKKCREWATDEKMSIYLRPATLFNRTKFAQYRGELGAVAA